MVLLVKIHVRWLTKPELSSRPGQISSWSERLLGGLYARYVTRHKPITSRVIFRDILNSAHREFERSRNLQETKKSKDKAQKLHLP